MKKIKFLTFSARHFVSNVIIFLMIFSLSIFAFYGVNLTSASKNFNGVYYFGNQKSNKVSLMINVYWGAEYLDRMLEILEENDVKTTFFVGGTWAVKNSDMLQKIFEAGHEIGNHGYYHKDHNKLSEQKNYEEILNTHKIVKEFLGVDMNLFAPPSGAFSSTTVSVADSIGYKTIMWTEGKDTIDWRDKDKNLIFSRATKNVKGGDFVLMHPTQATADALDDIVKTIKSKGLEICPVSQNLIG